MKSREVLNTTCNLSSLACQPRNQLILHGLWVMESVSSGSRIGHTWKKIGTWYNTLYYILFRLGSLRSLWLRKINHLLFHRDSKGGWQAKMMNCRAKISRCHGRSFSNGWQILVNVITLNSQQALSRNMNCEFSYVLELSTWLFLPSLAFL